MSPLSKGLIQPQVVDRRNTSPSICYSKYALQRGVVGAPKIREGGEYLPAFSDCILRLCSSYGLGNNAERVSDIHALLSRS